MKTVRQFLDEVYCWFWGHCAEPYRIPEGDRRYIISRCVRCGCDLEYIAGKWEKADDVS